MEKLRALARTETRSGYTFHIISDPDLRAWARSQNLTPRQATAEVLRKDIFPECFERNFPSLSGPEQFSLFNASVLVVGLGDLGGMLALPSTDWNDAPDPAPPFAADWRDAGEVRHTFTHFHLRLTVVCAEAPDLGPKAPALAEAEAAMPTVFAKALRLGRGVFEAVR